MKQGGIKPNTITYSSLINAYGKANQLSKMKEIVERMKKEGIESDVITYNSIIEALGSAEQIEKIIKFHTK